MKNWTKQDCNKFSSDFPTINFNLINCYKLVLAI